MKAFAMTAFVGLVLSLGGWTMPAADAATTTSCTCSCTSCGCSCCDCAACDC